MTEVLSVTTQGPTILNVNSVPIGLPQIRICPNWLIGPNPPKAINDTGDDVRDLTDAEKLNSNVQLMISQKLPILDSSWSVGGLNSVAFKTDKEDVEISSGWPKKVDAVIPISTKTYIECSARELSPFMSEVLSGKAPTQTAGTTLPTDTGFQSGLGAPSMAEWMRVEMVYNFPKSGKIFVIVLPKAQVTSSEELTFNDSEGMDIPFTITAGK